MAESEIERLVRELVSRLPGGREPVNTWGVSSPPPLAGGTRAPKKNVAADKKKKGVDYKVPYAERVRNDKARADSLSGRDRGRGQRIEQVRGIEDILREIMGSGGVGGVPTPDRNTFLAPFDRAEQATRNVHAEVVPSIGNTFTSLLGGIDEQASQFDQRMAALQQAAQQQQQQAAEAVRGNLTNVAIDPGELAGSLAAELAANTNANVADQGVRNQADAAFLQEIAAMGQGDTASQRSAAEAVGAGAKSNADMQLQQALNQIGMGRANAEGQYAQAAADAARQNASLQLEDRRLKLQEADAAMREWERQNEQVLEKATGSSWDRGIRQLETSNRPLYQEVTGLIGAIGTARNEINMSRALQAIDAELAEQSIDRRTAMSLADWVRRYYLPSDDVDPAEFKRLGGDPAYLNRR